MKKVLILTILFLGGLTAKSQTEGVMEFKPIPLEGNSDKSSKSSLNIESSIIDAYYINSYTNKPVKVKLKIVENKYGMFVIACKKLTDYSWADLSSEPIKTSKLLPSTPMSEYFEYKAFISRIQQIVYF